MAEILGRIAVAALIATLGSTIVAIWMEPPRADNFLRLTDSLLSWKVIAAALAIGAGVAFNTEIKSLLGRLAK